MEEKVKTGVEGLDILLEGGIPRNHSVLLAGSCGTGKTILSHKFLFTGAKEADENGLYISLSETKTKMSSYLKEFEFYSQQAIDTGKIRILDISVDARLRNLEPLSPKAVLNIITSVAKENESKRVVIDSITAICQSMGPEVNIREFLYELGMQLQHMDCTTILISEIPPMKFQYSIYGIEEFITDGVILLMEHEHKGDLLRTLQIIKMRGVSHSRARTILEINRKGIDLKPMYDI